MPSPKNLDSHSHRGQAPHFVNGSWNLREAKIYTKMVENCSYTSVSLRQKCPEAGGQKGGSRCQSKGNFPPRQGSRPESHAVFYQPESPGRPGTGPARTLGGGTGQGLRGI